MPDDVNLEGAVPSGTAVAEIRALADAAIEPIPLGEHALAVLVPEGYAVHTLDYRHLQPAPRRVTGVVQLQDPASFSAYVTDHSTAGTRVWATVSGARFVAVLNDHDGVGPNVDDAVPGWGDHRAVLQLQVTREWELWAGMDGNLVNQLKFAEHLEDGVANIVQPSAADMIELAQSFQAARSVDFKSATRLQSGEQQFRFEETLNANAGRQGQIAVPKDLVLGLQPFEGSDTYRVTARFRYRLDGGKLLLGYKLDRPQDVLRNAFNDVRASIDADTGLASYLGTPRP